MLKLYKLKIFMGLLLVFITGTTAHAKITFKLNFVDDPGTGMHLYPEAKEMMSEAIQEVLDYLSDEYNVHLEYDVEVVSDLDRYTLGKYTSKSFPVLSLKGSNKKWLTTLTHGYLVYNYPVQEESEKFQINLDANLDFKQTDPELRKITLNFKTAVKHEFIHALGFFGGSLPNSSLDFQMKRYTRMDTNGFPTYEYEGNIIPLAIDLSESHIRPVYPYDLCLMTSTGSNGPEKYLCKYEAMFLSDIGYKLKEGIVYGTPIPVMIDHIDKFLPTDIQVRLVDATGSSFRHALRNEHGVFLGSHTEASRIEVFVMGELVVSVPLASINCETYRICSFKDQFIKINLSKRFDHEKKAYLLSFKAVNISVSECLSKDQRLGEYDKESMKACEDSSKNDFVVMAKKDPSIEGIRLILRHAVEPIEKISNYLMIKEHEEGYEKVGYGNLGTTLCVYQGDEILGEYSFDNLYHRAEAIPLEVSGKVQGRLVLSINTRYDFKGRLIDIKYEAFEMNDEL